MIGAPTRVIQLAKEKSQKIIASKSEKFSYKIEKFLTVYQGYNQIKPKVFPKRLATMFSTDVVATEDKQDYFSQQQSTLAATSSLRRHQRERGLREGDIDTSSKIRIVLPATPTNRPTTSPTTLTLRSLVAPRTRKTTAGGPKTPTRIVLTNPERGNEAILCSSVVLTYQEGLFRNDKDMVRRDTDV